jgi:hypothetical protein
VMSYRGTAVIAESRRGNSLQSTQQSHETFATAFPFDRALI